MSGQTSSHSVIPRTIPSVNIPKEFILVIHHILFFHPPDLIFLFLSLSSSPVNAKTYRSRNAIDLNVKNIEPHECCSTCDAKYIYSDVLFLKQKTVNKTNDSGVDDGPFVFLARSDDGSSEGASHHHRVWAVMKCCVCKTINS